MEAKPMTIPAEVEQAESDLSEFLKRHNMYKPCPFDLRLDSNQAAKESKELVRSLGRRYQEATLGNYFIYHDKQREVLETLCDFARTMPEHLRSGGGLLLFGDPGTGKDHLVAALLKLAIKMHKLSVLRFDGGDLFDDIARHATESHDQLFSFQKRLLEPHILSISDPQPPKGELSAPQVRRVRDIIDRRYREGKSTWLTTNIDRREDAEALLTEPLMQRLREGSLSILCSWPSYRERNQP